LAVLVDLDGGQIQLVVTTELWCGLLLQTADTAWSVYAVNIGTVDWRPWAFAHMSKWGQLTPPLGKMDEKLKIENMQKRALF